MYLGVEPFYVVLDLVVLSKFTKTLYEYHKEGHTARVELEFSQHV